MKEADTETLLTGGGAELIRKCSTLKQSSLTFWHISSYIKKKYVGENCTILIFNIELAFLGWQDGSSGKGTFPPTQA